MNSSSSSAQSRRVQNRFTNSLKQRDLIQLTISNLTRRPKWANMQKDGPAKNEEAKCGELNGTLIGPRYVGERANAPFVSGKSARRGKPSFFIGHAVA